MYLKYINDRQISYFVKSITCPNANTIIVPDENKEFVNVFTNSLLGSFNITDFECVNIENGEIYSKKWRRFMIEQLDKCNLGNEYIDKLHEYLEKDTIYGPVL